MEENKIIEENKGFEIKNLDSAIWAFKQLKRLEDKKAEIQSAAANEIDQIKTWEQKEVKYLEDDVSFFKVNLEKYYKEQRDLDKKFRLTSPYGQVSSRKTKTYIYDDDIVIDYLKENDCKALRVKEEIDKTEFKRIYKDGINTETGEVIPGVEIQTVENITIKTI